MKLIHISDIHINSEPILGIDPVKNFSACLEHVKAHHSDADMVVISGDLTHHGEAASYSKLDEMLAECAFDPYLMVGNHDDREMFSAHFPHVGTDENGYVQYSQKTDVGLFLFLDTMEPGTHAGHYGLDRQNWLKQELEEAARLGDPVFIFLHHNPVDVGVASSDAIGVVEGEQLRQIFLGYRDTIRHIFFGHCHFVLSGSVCGIPMSAPRSTNHQCVPDFSGKSRMGFASYQPTYNVCLIDEDSVVVHSIEFCETKEITWHRTTADGLVKEKISGEA